MSSSERELAGCPFCGGAAHIKAIARDWWQIVIEHDAECMLEGLFNECIVPQDDESKALLIERWNARRAQASAEPVATVYTMEALVPGGSVKCHAQMHKALPAGTKLYALDSGKDLGALAREGEQ